LKSLSAKFSSLFYTDEFFFSSKEKEKKKRKEKAFVTEMKNIVDINFIHIMQIKQQKNV